MRCIQCRKSAEVSIADYIGGDFNILNSGADCPKCHSRQSVFISDYKSGAEFQNKMRDVTSKIRSFSGYRGRIHSVDPGGNKYYHDS